MSNYCLDDFCSPDEGLDYIFVYMGSVYGASFNRHWEGMELAMVRDVWKDVLGRFLTYKPSLDFGLRQMDADFPPSAIKFRNMCNAGPEIPVKPVPQIERQSTVHEQIKAAEAKAKLRELVQQMKMKV